jgi:hypothetical protein
MYHVAKVCASAAFSRFLLLVSCQPYYSPRGSLRLDTSSPARSAQHFLIAYCGVVSVPLSAALSFLSLLVSVLLDLSRIPSSASLASASPWFRWLHQASVSADACLAAAVDPKSP